MKFKMTILVLLGTLLIGSEVYGYGGYVEDKGRIGCGKCPAVYWPGESHVCKAVAAVPTTPSGQIHCQECNTYYPKNMRHVCPIPVRVVKKTTLVVQERVSQRPSSRYRYGRSRYERPLVYIDARFYQRPVRYVERRYYGYGGYGSYRYNLSGENYLAKWLGYDDDRDRYNRRYRSYRSYRSYRHYR